VTRSSSIVLAVVCVVVLGGAWVASRALTSDVSAPVTVQVPAAPGPQPVVAPVRVEPPVPGPVAQLPEPARAQPQPEPPGVAPPLEPKPAEADPDSDYADENSPLVQEEWRAAFGPRAGVAEWTHGVKVFERCLVQAPGNQRCQQGLAALQAQLNSAAVPVHLPPAALRPPPALRRHHDNRTGEE